MSKFSFDINKELLKERTLVQEDDVVENDDEALNDAMKVAKDILNTLDKHDISYYEAYVILASLADSVYLYSTFSDVL